MVCQGVFGISAAGPLRYSGFAVYPRCMAVCGAAGSRWSHLACWMTFAAGCSASDPLCLPRDVWQSGGTFFAGRRRDLERPFKRAVCGGETGHALFIPMKEEPCLLKQGKNRVRMSPYTPSGSHEHPLRYFASTWSSAGGVEWLGGWTGLAANAYPVTYGFCRFR